MVNCQFLGVGFQSLQEQKKNCVVLVPEEVEL